MTAGLIEEASATPTDREAVEVERHDGAVRRDILFSQLDGVGYNLMVGLGETYLPAFVLALGLGSMAAGFITTIPVMLGAMLQLLAPRGIRAMRSHRRWVVLCARVQAFSLFGFPLATIAPESCRLTILFGTATVYWCSSLAAGASWNTWIERIIPAHMRTQFLANRVRFSQLSLLTGFLIGGWVLTSPAREWSAGGSFCLLFLMAASARFVSAGMLACKSDPVWERFPSPDSDSMAGDRSPLNAAQGNAAHGNAVHGNAVHGTAPSSAQDLGQVVPWHEIRAWIGSAEGRVVRYFLVMTTAVYISGPFFTPYMIGQLKFHYGQYTMLLAFAYLGKVIAAPAWGRFARRFGPHRLLAVGSLGIVPLAALWIPTRSWGMLAVNQCLGGMLWSAYELSMLILLIDAIPRAKRTAIMSIYNVGNSIAMFIGGGIGALCLWWFGGGMTAFLCAFGLSSLVRCAAFLIFMPYGQRAVVAVRDWSHRHWLTKTTAIRPGSGSIEQPILAGLDVNVVSKTNS